MPMTLPSLLRRTGAAVLVAVAALMVVSVQGAHAQVRIDITNPNVQPIPIAIQEFHGATPELQDLGRKISGVVSADLERSGLFRPLNPAGFVQKINSVDMWPRFEDWRVLNAQVLLVGEATMQPDGKLQVSYRAWDVFAGQALDIPLSKLATVPNNWRRMAHMIADEIYKRVTGESGYFNTRVIYISETGPADKRIKRLAIMDQDGENHVFLTNGQHLVLTPRFSPRRQEITYLAYVNQRPRVYLLDINSGRQEVLGDFPGMTFAPRFSPDGAKVVMSHAQNGNTDIYVMDLATRRSTRLTDHPAIDTSPSYSPDGGRIVFESDRGGSQQLYVMNADGGNVQRLTFGQGRYGNPVWSPRGDLIAFTRIHDGRFFVGVIRPDGSGERMLSEAFHVEGPAWAPNGRVLMYFKERPVGADGKARVAKLYTIDLTGRNEREVVTPLDASDPAWSPLLN